MESALGRVAHVGVRSIDTARAYGNAAQPIGEILRKVPTNEGWRVIIKLAPDVHQEGGGIAECLERVATSLSDSRMSLGLGGAR